MGALPVVPQNAENSGWQEDTPAGTPGFGACDRQFPADALHLPLYPQLPGLKA